MPGVGGVTCQIASSCSEYSLQVYSLLSITIDSYRLLPILLFDNNRKNIFSVTLITIYFRYQSILICGLNRLTLTISIDFRYRFLSINYIWSLIRALISNRHTKRIMGSYEKRSFWGEGGGGGWWG